MGMGHCLVIQWSLQLFINLLFYILIKSTFWLLLRMFCLYPYQVENYTSNPCLYRTFSAFTYSQNMPLSLKWSSKSKCFVCSTPKTYLILWESFVYSTHLIQSSSKQVKLASRSSALVLIVTVNLLNIIAIVGHFTQSSPIRKTKHPLL